MRVHRLVLSLATTAVAAGGLLIAGAASAQTSFGGCFLPTDAGLAFVSDWTDSFPDAATEKECKKQCKQLDKGCKSAASAGNQCTKSAGKSFFSSEKIFCKGLPNKDDQKSCKESVKSAEKTQKEALKSNQSTAKDGCKTAKSACDTSCGIQ
jgi:hypothetical protein